LAPSERYDNAQQISVIISSFSFSTSTLIKVGTALLTKLYYGYGRPLHKLDKAHDAFLMNEVPATALSNT
jgi:vacuolar-type H+-ATPase catalytic subunit A/Vma1